MKKTFALLLVMGLMMSFVACGTQEVAVSENQEEPVPVETVSEPVVEEIMAASESDAAALAEMEPPASQTDITVDESGYNAALELVGQPVQALYDAIGEPEDSQYAASCLEDNAEDGMLFYEGFYVWSLRTEEDEVIHAVYLND